MQLLASLLPDLEKSSWERLIPASIPLPHILEQDLYKNGGWCEPAHNVESFSYSRSYLALGRDITGSRDGVKRCRDFSEFQES